MTNRYSWYSPTEERRQWLALRKVMLELMASSLQRYKKTSDKKHMEHAKFFGEHSKLFKEFADKLSTA